MERATSRTIARRTLGTVILLAAAAILLPLMLAFGLVAGVRLGMRHGPLLVRLIDQAGSLAIRP